jgi:phage tail-like protein
MKASVFKDWRTLLALGSAVAAASLAGVYLPAAHAARPIQDDDRGAFRFMVEIEGVEAGFFREVSGLSVETEVVEIQEGGEQFPRKRPGRTKYANIVLKRGVLHNGELWSWRQRIIDGTYDPREAAIIMIDRADREMLRWELHRAFPVKWEGPGFDASKNEIAIETIEIAVEGFDRMGG